MMQIEVLITVIGLLVAGLAAILGMWMERDQAKPPRYAYAISMLILMATGVGMFQTYMDAKNGEKMEADMARMLRTLDKIAQESDVEIPELNAFVKGELEAQSRANPDVVERFAQRVADDGEDPTAVLGSYLPPSELENFNRNGVDIKPKQVSAPPAPAAAEGETAEAPTKRRRSMKFGGKIVVPEPKAAPEADKPKLGGLRGIGKRGGDDKEEAADEEGKEPEADADKGARIGGLRKAAPTPAAVGVRPGTGPKKPEAPADKPKVKGLR